jgi:hypothetical protein
MHESEILEVIDCFTQAAKRCQAAGFDGVDATTSGAARWKTAAACRSRSLTRFAKPAVRIL